MEYIIFGLNGCKILLSHNSVKGGGQNFSGILLEEGILEQSDVGGCDSGLSWNIVRCTFLC